MAENEDVDEDYTIRPRPGIKVYTNKFHEIVITNFSDETADDDSDSYVRVDARDARRVAEWIMEEAADILGVTRDQLK